MDHKRTLYFSLFLILCPVFLFSQAKFSVSTQAEFNSAQSQATTGDSIVWASGTYDNIFMDITQDGVIVTAEVSGQVIMQGSSKVEIPADDVVLSGIQFIEGNIGTDHVIRIDGSDILITQINISRYTCYKYLIIDELSQRVTVSYSNFENRLNKADQNILSILVDDTTPGYHKIQYCSFKNFAGGGNDEGVEPIRIGVSTQSEFNSRSIVEYCYFTNCDGDGEIISYKASQNVIRYNTFENNTKAEVVLRHGDDAIVYGNFFINNMGGVRVREGQNHFIYNNYFEGLERRSIFLQNESSDPLDFIHVYFNTIVDSEEMRLGGDGGSNPPQNVVIANNIFANPKDNLFLNATGNETWIANISLGSLGITRPAGISESDPLLAENAEGFLQLSTGSPAIDGAESGFPNVPTYDGLDFDNEILLDLMRQSRPATVTSRDIGAGEFSNVVVKPHVDETNTGPAYLLSNQEFVTLNTSVQGEGSISLDPSSDSYIAGTSVRVTAIAAENSNFIGWSGALSGTTNPQTIVLNESTTISAMFEADPDPPTPLGLSKESSIKLFPNPVKSKLNLEFKTELYQRMVIKIYSAIGKEVDQIVLSKSEDGTNNTSLNVDKYQPGIYFIQMKMYGTNGDLMASEMLKFLKQ